MLRAAFLHTQNNLNTVHLPKEELHSMPHGPVHHLIHILTDTSTRCSARVHVVCFLVQTPIFVKTGHFSGVTGAFGPNRGTDVSYYKEC